MIFRKVCHSTEARDLRVIGHLARVLLRLYPTDFRREYGVPFVETSEDLWRRERRLGRSRARATWTTTIRLLADTWRGRSHAAAHPQRRLRGSPMTHRALTHLRYAIRSLSRAPVLIAVATVSLAIGIGANTAVFAAANALFFAPAVGVANMGALVEICRTTDGAGCDGLPYSTYVDLSAQTKTLSGLYAVSLVPGPMSVETPDGAAAAQAQFVSLTYFKVLGARPQLGGFFSTLEEPLSARVREVVFSDDFWRTAFRADTGIIGRGVRINGDDYVVTGVAAPHFQGANILKPDLWVPILAKGRGTPSEQFLRRRDAAGMVMGGRLAANVTFAQARAEVGTLAAEHPLPTAAGAKLGVMVRPMQRMPAGLDFARPFVAIVMALVGLVLLVACANLAGLLSARAAGRSRETTIRCALGASRGSLVTQFVVEGIVLFIPGAVLAFGVAAWMMRVLDRLIPLLPLPIGSRLVIDWRVAVFAMATTFTTALLTSLVPSLEAARGTSGPDWGRHGGGRGHQRLRRMFVVAQLAFCLTAIVIAGLLFQTVRTAVAIDPGFQVDRMQVANIVLTLGGYTNAQIPSAVATIEDHVRALPGVRSVGAGAIVPVSDTTMSLGELRRLGDPASSSILGTGFAQRENWSVVTASYFSTLHIPIVNGRAFTPDDRAGALPVAIVNQRLADLMWPGQNPVGRQLEHGDFRPGQESSIGPLTVVGVTNTGKYVSIDEPPVPFIYVPFAQRPFTHAYFFIEPSGTAATAGLASELRAALRTVNPRLPIIGLAHLRQYLDVDLMPRRIAALVAGTLGGLAVVLAAIGLYGLTSFVVASRTKELGLRMALGANAATVVRLVLGQALVLGGVGAAIGVVLAIGLSRIVGSLLLGVSALDPATFGLATVAVVATAGLAAYRPARRAAALNPTVAFRMD